MSHYILIGGGELKNRETLKIDEYLVSLAKRHAGEARARALFLPTASHDCMPYYNTFHKVYTGIFGISTDVALTVGRVIDFEKMRAKFERADLIYVGGGDTVFLIDSWKQTGLLPLIEDAIGRGVPVAGLSAGAICWFEEMYSDSVKEGEYAVYPGLGYIKGKISPHYGERMLDFDRIVMYNKWCAWGLENNAALEIRDGDPVRSISAGGNVFWLDGRSEELVKTKF